MMLKYALFMVFWTLLAANIKPSFQVCVNNVIAKLSQDSGCFTNTRLMDACTKELLMQRIRVPSQREFKKVVDNTLTKLDFQRQWSTYNSLEYKICLRSPSYKALYLPQMNTTSVNLSVKHTLDKYPYLRQNLDPGKITELLMLLPQQFRTSFQIKRYTIIDHVLYKDSYPENSFGEYDQILTPLLPQLPDMDFVYIMRYQIDHRGFQDFAERAYLGQAEFDGTIELYRKIIIQLPAFMTVKDLYVGLEFNKLLLVDVSKFHSSWKSIVDEVGEGSMTYKWEDKIEKGFSRNVANGLPHANVDPMTNVPLYFSRLHLVMMSRNNPELLDAEFVGDNTYWEHLFSKVDFKLKKVQDVSLKDHFKYKYLISVDGWAASKRKCPMILHSNSVLLKQDTGKVSWYYDQLVPDVHYVSISKTLDNLLDKIRFLRQNDQLAKNIVKQANAFFDRKLAGENLKLQVVRILKEYASQQQFTPGFLVRKMYQQYNMTRMQDRVEYVNKNKSLTWSFVILCLVLLVSHFGLRLFGRNRCMYSHQDVICADTVNNWVETKETTDASFMQDVSYREVLTN